MRRDDVLQYAKTKYQTDPEFPWGHSPPHAILRHSHNRKWYGALMNLPRTTLNLPGEGNIDVINVKCEPAMNYLLRQLPGFLPAYHMNKEHWVTILLDGTVDRVEVTERIDDSYELTK